MFKVLESKPEFSVSEEGQIKWNATGALLSQSKDKDGYLRCCYRSKGKTHHVTVHRAVAEAYVENPKPEEYNIVNHLDGNKINNSPKNLEWTNPFGNRQHSQFTGSHSVRGEAHSRCKITTAVAAQICEMLSLGMRVKDIAEKLNIAPYYIQNIKRGLAWREIAEKYRLNIPRKETISVSTLKWIKQQLEVGYTFEEVCALNTNLRKVDKDRIQKLLVLVNA